MKEKMLLSFILAFSCRPAWGQAKGPRTVAAPGRYQLFSADAAAQGAGAQVYLLDTETGRVWAKEKGEAGSRDIFLELPVEKEDNERYGKESSRGEEAAKEDKEREAKERLGKDFLSSPFQRRFLQALREWAGKNGFVLSGSDGDAPPAFEALDIDSSRGGLVYDLPVILLSRAGDPEEKKISLGGDPALSRAALELLGGLKREFQEEYKGWDALRARLSHDQQ